MKQWLKYLGVVATGVFVVAVAGFGQGVRNYSQVEHPVELLGGVGLPHALAFNLLGLVLPGMLAGVVVMELRQRLPAQLGWSARIGVQLLFLSALGMIALGLLPLDPLDLNNQASRLHATAWMLWWVAFVPGTWMLAFGLRGQAEWGLLAGLGRVAGAGMLAMVLFGVVMLPGGIAQRIAFACWFGWLSVAAWGPRPPAAIR